MDSIGAQLFKLVRDKNYKWADEQVTNIRMYWEAIYPTNEAAINRSYLNCKQSMEGVKKKFKPNTKFYKETKWRTLPFMFKIMKRLGELLMAAPPKCEVKADDPTAISGKEQDINILRTRKIYENGLNRANKVIGEPPQKLDISKAKSNIGDFDKLQLNDQDEEDLSLFNQFIQKMGYEISVQKLLKAIFSINKFDEFNLFEALHDLGSNNAVCYDTYVDELTGEQVIKKIDPEDARGIWGQRYDGRDDIAKGWERSMPLREFLGMVGDAFDITRDWADLLWAINGHNNTRFTGFDFGNGQTLDTWADGNTCQYSDWHKAFGCEESRICSFSQAYRYNVLGVKAEWYAPDAIGTPYLRDREKGTMTATSVSYVNYESDEKMFTQYAYEQETRWVAYNAIALGFTLSTQRIYRWGEIYLQQPEGAYDEYCIGTMRYYRLPGVTLGELVQNYIDTANEAFFKIRWILAQAKPRAKQIVFNEMIAMARAMKDDKDGLLKKDGKVQNNQNNMLENLFNFMEEHVEYDIRFYPQVRGMDVPQIPTLRDTTEGIDPLTTALQLIERWAEEQIMDKIGGFEADKFQPRTNKQQQEAQTMYAATQVGWLHRIFQYVKKDIASALISYTHDVVKYKQSLACKWIKNLIGDKDFEWLSNLGDVAPHRMAIFFNDFNTQKMKDQVDQSAMVALESKQITLPQYNNLTQTEDYKLESKKLEIFIRKQEKKLRKQAIADQIRQHQFAMDEEKQREQTEQTKGQLALDKQKMQSDAEKYVADKQYAAKVDTTEMKQENEPEKQGLRNENAKDLATHKANLEQQEALS